MEFGLRKPVVPRSPLHIDEVVTGASSVHVYACAVIQSVLEEIVNTFLWHIPPVTWSGPEWGPQAQGSRKSPVERLPKIPRCRFDFKPSSPQLPLVGTDSLLRCHAVPSFVEVTPALIARQADLGRRSITSDV